MYLYIEAFFVIKYQTNRNSENFTIWGDYHLWSLFFGILNLLMKKKIQGYRFFLLLIPTIVNRQFSLCSISFEDELTNICSNTASINSLRSVLIQKNDSLLDLR